MKFNLKILVKFPLRILHGEVQPENLGGVQSEDLGEVLTEDLGEVLTQDLAW